MRSALALLAFVSERLTENARLRRQSRPRPSISLQVLGPSGKEAVQIQFGERA